MIIRLFRHLLFRLALLTVLFPVGVSFTLIQQNTTVYAAGTMYYIDNSNNSNCSDSGNATSDQPWCNVSAANGHTFQPDDQILLKAGDLWTNQQLAPQGSGSSGHPIIINQYGSGNKPRIDGQGNATYGTVYLHGQQYWEINNLELTNEGSTNAYKRAGVYVTAAANATVNHIHIQNLLIHDVNGYKDSSGNGPATETGGIIVVGDDAANGTINGTFDDILIANNTVHDVGASGIWVGAALGGTNVALATHVVVQNNSAYNIGANGVWTYGTHGALLDHNTVHDTDTYNVSSASMWDFGSDSDIFQHNEVYRTGPSNDGEAFDCDGGNNRNNIYQYNYSHDNQNGFFTWYDTNGANSGCIVRYNISQNDGRSAFNNAGISHAAQIYNNTIYIDSDATTNIVDGNLASDATFSNNIIYNLGSGGYNHTTGGTWTHNLFYGNHPSDEPADTDKLTSDPLLDSPGGGGAGIDTATSYQLQPGSPALGSGVLIGNNGGQDFFGNTVSSSTNPNRGAYNGAGVTGGGGNITVKDTDTGIQFNGFTAFTGQNTSLYLNGTVHASKNPGDSFEYTCESCREILWQATRNSDQGIADVLVDGTHVATVDDYASGRRQASGVVFGTGLLSAGRHTLKVVIDSAKNPSSTDHWIELNVLQVITSANVLKDTDASIQFNGFTAYTGQNTSLYLNGTVHASKNPGDSFEYTCDSCKEILWQATRNSDQGIADVSVDGTQVATVDDYASGGRQATSVVFGTGLLGIGKHTLKVVIDSANNPSSTDHWIELNALQVIS